jgi:N-acetylmuramoyl-L-alanine amidase
VQTYVELDGVELGGAARETPIGGIVTRMLAESTTTGSRVSLDLSGPAYRRVFHLLEPFRVVVDIAKHPPGSGPKGTSRTIDRIVIDPGHGGNDPGAQGPTGLREKDVTLAVAHKVAPILARQGIQVALTRDDDRYVTLEERTARANAFGADLFVSIHCNAAEKKDRRGVETYVLDTTTSDMAGRVAARENATSTAASNEVAQLLASMRLADQATRSTRFAELLQRAGVASLGAQYDGVQDGGVHRAAFYVLVGARMPAVLFETSYISNATEEQRLGANEYQQRLADAIANAVKAYREGR